MTTRLTERERQVLEAVIETYVQTAEPAGSRTISRRHLPGLSPATIRNTMSDLEEKGYLYHPHTSAGRIPTDLAYRMYVDFLMKPSMVAPADEGRIRGELSESGRAPVETILARAAQVLGVLTNELGVAIGPTLEEAVLDRLDIIKVSSERLLLVLALQSGAVRTIFVEVTSEMPADAVQQVSVLLNERLAGLTMKEIRTTLGQRLRDAGEPGSTELLNIFIQEADELFDVPVAPAAGSGGVLLGSTQPLAGQPEFATKEQLRGLLDVTERRDLLREAITARGGEGLTITIGQEHGDARLLPFTLITSTYHFGPLSGVIGVMGPTRMPYDKSAALVNHTSRLVGELLE